MEKNEKKQNNGKYFWNAFTFSLFIPLYLFLMYIVFINNDNIPNTIKTLDFVLLSIATLRLTRLFVYDSVTAFLRKHFASKDNGFYQNITELLGCPWCLSMWFALLLVFLYYLSPITYSFIVLLAVAGFASLIQLVVSLLGKIVDNGKYRYDEMSTINNYKK